MPTDDFRKYILMRDAGANANAVYLASQEDGLDNITTIRMLRAVFDLSLPQAKEVGVVADGLADSLGDYQERYILPALEAIGWLADLEKDIKRRGFSWSDYWERRDKARAGGQDAFASFLHGLARKKEQVSTLQLINSSPDPLYLTMKPFGGDNISIPPGRDYSIVALTGPNSLQIESDDSHFTVWLGRNGEVVHGDVFSAGRAVSDWPGMLELEPRLD